MKKTIAVVVAFVLSLVLLTACGQTPMEQYKALYETYSKITAIDCDLTSKVEIAIENTKQSVETSGNVKYDFTDSTNPKIDGKLSVNQNGTALEMALVYTDGTAYVNLLGQKIRSEIPYSQIGELISGVNKAQLFGEDALKSLTVENEGDGKVFKYEIDPEKSTLVSDEIMLAVGEADAEIKFSTLTGEIHVDKSQKITKILVNAVATVTSSGITVDCTYDILQTVRAVGADVKIELPADVDSYIDPTKQSAA